jgi:hypothetical protein
MGKTKKECTKHLIMYVAIHPYNYVCRYTSILLNLRFTKKIHIKNCKNFEYQLPLHFINNGNEMLLLLPPFHIVVRDLFWKMGRGQAQYSTAQHSTVQYSTVKCSTVQQSTAK